MTRHNLKPCAVEVENIRTPQLYKGPQINQPVKRYVKHFYLQWHSFEHKCLSREFSFMKHFDHLLLWHLKHLKVCVVLEVIIFFGSQTFHSEKLLTNK